MTRAGLGRLLLAAVVVTGLGAAGAAAQEGGRFRDCPHCPEMVVAAPGRFVMGDPAGLATEQPARPVTIAHRFAYGQSKVSVQDWRRCVLGGLCPGVGAGGTGGLEPVVLVSWIDVQQYLLWLNLETGVEYRLLSEAEWEYLARGAGPDDAGLGAEGLEWTSDCWHPDYTDAPTDGSSWDSGGDCRYHVARGRRPGEAAPSVSRRYRFLFTAQDPALGFRVARTLRP